MIKRFVYYENENLIFYGNFENEHLEIEFKPNCPKKIKDMWKKLNEPIRR